MTIYITINKLTPRQDLRVTSDQLGPAMSRSRKRKLTEASDEADKLREVVQNMTTQMRVKDLENSCLRRENDGLQLELEKARMKSIGVSAAIAKQVKHVNDLPNALLLRIMSGLEPLFVADVASRVCQRWSALARDPAIWSKVELRYAGRTGSKDYRLFARALSLASEVGTLECNLTADDPPAVHRALETCATATTHLCVNLETAAPEVVLHLLWNSRNSLQIFCVCEGPLGTSSFSPSQACRFWQLIEEAPKLLALVLFLGQRSGLASCHHFAKPTTKPSLRTLFVDVGIVDPDQDRTPAGIVTTLVSFVRAHAKTLRDVHIPIRVTSGCARSALGALSRSRVLSRMSTPLTRDLHLLASCSQLRELKMTVDLHLLHLLLLQCVLRSLGELRQLQVLRIVQLSPRSDVGVDVASRILGVLPTLVELRELELSCLPRASALDALAALASAAKAPPLLEVLRIDQACGDATDGGSAMECSLPAFRRLLRQYPGLHVVQGSVTVGPRCGADHLGVVDTRPLLPVAFVGHVGNEGCLVCGELLRTGGQVMQLDGVLPWVDVDLVTGMERPVQLEQAAGSVVPLTGVVEVVVPPPSPDEWSVPLTDEESAAVGIKVLAILPYESRNPGDLLRVPWISDGDMTSPVSPSKCSKWCLSPPITVSIPLWKLGVEERRLAAGSDHVVVSESGDLQTKTVGQWSTVVVEEINNNSIAVGDEPVVTTADQPSVGGIVPLPVYSSSAVMTGEDAGLITSPRRNLDRACKSNATLVPYLMETSSDEEESSRSKNAARQRGRSGKPHSKKRRLYTHDEDPYLCPASVSEMNAVPLQNMFKEPFRPMTGTRPPPLVQFSANKTFRLDVPRSPNLIRDLGPSAFRNITVSRLNSSPPQSKLKLIRMPNPAAYQPRGAAFPTSSLPVAVRPFAIDGVPTSASPASRPAMTRPVSAWSICSPDQSGRSDLCPPLPCGRDVTESEVK